jgi:hypothetical protein
MFNSVAIAARIAALGGIWKVAAMAAAALVVLLLTTVGVLYWMLSEANEDLDAARAKVAVTEERLGRCDATLATYKMMVDQQNKAVAALKLDGERRTAEAAKALEAVRIEAARKAAAATKRAEALVAPTPAAADCKAAIGLIRRELKP